MYPTQLFGLREVYESSETQKQKDSKINNKMIHKSSIQIRSMNSLNEGEYPKQTQEGMPENNKRKEDVLNILKEYGVPLKKFLGWCSNDEKQNEHMNKLR